MTTKTQLEPRYIFPPWIVPTMPEEQLYDYLFQVEEIIKQKWQTLNALFAVQRQLAYYFWMKRKTKQQTIFNLAFNLKNTVQVNEYLQKQNGLVEEREMIKKSDKDIELTNKQIHTIPTKKR